MAAYPLYTPSPNGYQIIGQALTDASKQLTDFSERQARLKQQIEEMTQRRAAAIVAQKLAEEESKRKDAEDRRQEEDEKRKADADKRASKFRQLSSGTISPTLQENPSLSRRSQFDDMNNARMNTELQDLYNVQGLELPSQEVRAGSDATALLGQALDRQNVDIADGRYDVSDDEIRRLGLQFGMMDDVKKYIDSGKGGSRASYRDIEIPDPALPAWDRSLIWYNQARRKDASVNQIDLMERFVQEQIDDGIPRETARQIQTKASSRINQVYGTGIRNPWDATEKMVGAGKAATEAREMGIDILPGTKSGTAWTKETRQAIQTIVDKAKQDYNFKEHTESIAEAQKVLEAQAMAKDKPAALAASITAVARMMSPGVVTAMDFAVLTDYGAPAGLRTWDQVLQWATGQPPEKKVQVIAGISAILKKAAQRTSADILNIAYESAIASNLNVNRDQLWEFIAPPTARKLLDMDERPTAKATANPKIWIPTRFKENLTPNQRQLVAFAKKNPKDPRAAVIFEKYGVK